MSLKNLLLGLIDIHPMPGYDLMKVFDDSILCYWHVTQTQLYNTLKVMEKDGLVEGEVVHQTGAPSKKIFSITEEGKKALDDWLNDEPEVPGFKHPFLAKLAFGAKLSDDALLAQLDRYAQKLRERLLNLESKRKLEYLRLSRSEREYVLWELTFDNGMMYYSNELKWVELAKERLTSGK